MDVFPITPAGARPLVFLAIVGGVLLLVLFLLTYSAYSSRNARVEVGGESIRLVGDLWGREVPLTALRLAEARVIRLSRERDLQPHRRTMGTGLPGYSAGWFKLRSGEKALVCVTHGDKVV